MQRGYVSQYISVEEECVFETETQNANGPAEHEISVLIALVSSEGFGESAHMRSLVRVFTARIHKVWM